MELIIKFALGALIYLGIEVMWDGATDRRMGLVGGIAFVVCGQADDWFCIPNILVWIMIGTIIVLLEFVAGCLWNRTYTIWDYRKIPFNYKGQISLPFYILWIFPIAPLILWMDNILLL